MKRFTKYFVVTLCIIFFISPIILPCQKISAEIIHDAEIKSIPADSLKDYVLKFIYNDTSILVSADSVGGFLRECYIFPTWMDAVKYWYDKDEFNIELNKRGDIPPFYLDPSAEGTIRINIPECEGIDYLRENNLFVDYSSILYHNGDAVREYDSFPTVLFLAIIVGNHLKITEFSIGDHTKNVVSALRLPDKMSSENLENVLIRRTGKNTPLDYSTGSFFDDVNLTFESDTLKIIQIHAGEWLTIF